MRLLVYILPLLLSFSLSSFDGGKIKLKKLVGTWRVVKIERTDGSLKNAQLTIVLHKNGDYIRTKDNGRQMKGYWVYYPEKQTIRFMDSDKLMGESLKVVSVDKHTLIIKDQHRTHTLKRLESE